LGRGASFFFTTFFFGAAFCSAAATMALSLASSFLTATAAALCLPGALGGVAVAAPDCGGFVVAAVGGCGAEGASAASERVSGECGSAPHSATNATQSASVEGAISVFCLESSDAAVETHVA